MSDTTKTSSADAVRVPVEATLEPADPASVDLRLRTDSGVILRCARDRLPKGARAGDRLVVERATYLATVDTWICGAARLAGAAPEPPSGAAEFWTRNLRPQKTPADKLAAVTVALEALANIRASSRAGGHALSPRAREEFLEVGRARLADVIRPAAEVAPTLTRLRLASSPGVHAEWRRPLEEQASRVPADPEAAAAAPALVFALERLRSEINRHGFLQGRMSAPASPYERAQHHARVSPPAPVRTLLGLTNGFSLYDGVVELAGIFDGPQEDFAAHAGRDAGTVRVRFPTAVGSYTAFRLSLAADGSLVTMGHQGLSGGSQKWRELPPDPRRRDLPSFLDSLTTLTVRQLPAIFRVRDPSDAAVPAAPPALSLDALHARLGTPDLTRIDGSVLDRPIEYGMSLDLMWMAEGLTAGDVLADATRVYDRAWAFFARATPAQRELLGLSQERLAAGVLKACELRMLDDDVRKERDPAHPSRARRLAEAELAKGLLLHEEARRVVQSLLGRARLTGWQPAQNEPWTAETAHKLADGLCELSDQMAQDLGRVRSDRDAEARVELSGASDELRFDLDAAAEAIRTTAEAADPDIVAEGNEDALKLLIGVNRLLLEQVIDAFAAAHKLDATIPLLGLLTEPTEEDADEEDADEEDADEEA